MQKKSKLAILMVFGLILFTTTTAKAATETPTMSNDEFVVAKNLIDQNIPCPQLSQDQLIKIGDYYMEQMMPGQAHENMEQILGGEGSASLDQAHIYMARRWYCGDAAGYGMMGMMSGNFQSYNQGYGLGMMGNKYYSYGNSWNFGGPIMMILGVIFLSTGIAAFAKYLLKK